MTVESNTAEVAALSVADKYADQFQSLVTSASTYLAVWLTSLILVFLASVVPVYETAVNLEPQPRNIAAARALIKQADTEKTTSSSRSRAVPGRRMTGIQDLDDEIRAREAQLQWLNAEAVRLPAEFGKRDSIKYAPKMILEEARNQLSSNTAQTERVLKDLHALKAQRSILSLRTEPVSGLTDRKDECAWVQLIVSLRGCVR